jgi:hypothetical protein
MAELDAIRKKQMDDLLAQLNKATEATDKYRAEYPDEETPLPFRPEVEKVVNQHLKETSSAMSRQRDEALLRNIVLKNKEGIELSPEEEVRFMQIKRQIAGEKE